METNAQVYVGGWTNWSEGSVRGARITLTDAGGAYLIAFLALFVRLAGQHSWRILCYLSFVFRQRRLPRGNDAFQSASQSILRNTSIDISAAWQFLIFSWEHESIIRGRLVRSLAWTVFATLHAIVFIAAGIFVSKVADSGSTVVLLRGPVCGVWQDPEAYGIYSSGNQSDILENNLWSSWLSQQVLAAAEFSRQCYNVSSSASALANCNAYAPELVVWNATTNVKCPFDSKMCKDDLVVSFDSGLLDSLHHFGVNAKPQDRIKYRRVVECSPLIRENYVSGILNVSQIVWPNATYQENGPPQQNGLLQEYNYGPNYSFNISSTYIWNNGTMNPNNWGNIGLAIYQVDVELAMTDCPDCSTFTPIDELNRTDADVIMYFLLTNVRYIEQINDPWFKATTPIPSSDSIFLNQSPDTFDVYTADYNASVMACTQQFQYCNHDGSLCSELRGEGWGGSLVDSIDNFSNCLKLNAKQASTLSRLAQASWNADLYYAAFANGGGNLLAELASASQWALPGLPDNQWILEMQHYFLIGLTSMQMQMAAYAVGPPNANSYQYLTAPSPDERWMCTSQLVQRTGFSTFSVLGIVTVVVVGVLLVVINLSLPVVANGRVRYHVKRKSQQSSAWHTYHHISRALHNHESESVYQLTDVVDDIGQSLRSGTPSTMIDAPESAKQARMYESDFSKRLGEVDSTKVKKHNYWGAVRHKYQKAQQEVVIA